MRQYIPSIDGLRAIAVLGVVLFHFFPEQWPGGFVGVDVFFAISGYLVTKIIQQSIDEKRFSFIEFYRRRIRRLLPALLTVLISSFIVAFFTLLNSEIQAFGRHLFAGTFFFSNIQFFSEAGYFDKASEAKPLLHLWSLSLEEQFYFFWPVILMALYKLRRFSPRDRFIETALCVLCVVSLALSIYYTAHYQKLAFFNLPFRLWELGAGGLLAIIEARSGFVRLLSSPLGRWLPPIGLLTILVTYFTYTKDTAFPGIAALLPILGTLGVLVNSRRSDGLARLLESRVLIYIGKVSYPFYLWHWPIFSFNYVICGGQSSVLHLVLLILVSFGLACLTYELIEKRPSTSRVKSIPILLTANFVIGLIGLSAGSSTFKEIRPSYLSKVDPVLESKVAFLGAHQNLRKSGFCTSNGFANLELCAIHDENKAPTIALIGDSHAHHWFPGISKHLPKEENLVLLAKSGTPPLIGLKSRRSPDADMESELSFVLKSPTIKTVILAGFWSNYFEERGTLVSGYQYKNTVYSAKAPNASQAELLTTHLIRTLGALSRAGKKIIFLYDTPALSFDLENCLPRPFRPSKNPKCTYKMAEELGKQKSYREAFAPILHKREIQTGDPLKLMCPKEFCPLRVGDFFLYSDSHHFSVWGSEYIAGQMHDLWSKK